jgi:hypothetical protein
MGLPNECQRQFGVFRMGRFALTSEIAIAITPTVFLQILSGLNVYQSK